MVQPKLLKRLKHAKNLFKPPRTEQEAREQIEYFINRDRKLLERLAKQSKTGEAR